MKLAWTALSVAALVGAGYLIGKKLTEKKMCEDDFYELDDLDDLANEDGIDVGVYTRTNYGDKIKKASLFAVGAIKTGADKIGETISDIKTKDMVKKGEKTVEAVKEAGDNIKNDIKRDIEDLKSMVASINDEEKAANSDDLFESAPDSIFDGDDDK